MEQKHEEDSIVISFTKEEAKNLLLFSDFWFFEEKEYELCLDDSEHEVWKALEKIAKKLERNFPTWEQLQDPKFWEDDPEDLEPVDPITAERHIEASRVKIREMCLYLTKLDLEFEKLTREEFNKGFAIIEKAHKGLFELLGFLGFDGRPLSEYVNLNIQSYAVRKRISKIFKRVEWCDDT